MHWMGSWKAEEKMSGGCKKVQTHYKLEVEQGNQPAEMKKRKWKSKVMFFKDCNAIQTKQT